MTASTSEPYAPNGVEESSLVEIEVKAYKRAIGRPRWRRTCECASSPMEVSAHRDGVIALPPQRGRRNPPRPIVFGPDTEPPLFPARSPEGPKRRSRGAA